MSDAVNEAASRLEQAVEKLAAVIAARPANPPGVPPEAVAALSARLDETLSRLRGALADIDGGEPVEDAAADVQNPAPPARDEIKES